MRLRGPVPPHPARLVGAASLMILAPAAAGAHGGIGVDDSALLMTWPVDPFLTGLAVFVLAIWFRGLSRGRRTGAVVPRWRRAVFLAGFGFIYLSLQSPIDPLGERLFWVHQVQHMLIRVAGPLLVMFSRPQPVLMAGAPRALRRWIIVPVARSRAWRSGVGGLARPAPAFALFVASLYFWQIPRVHNAAILNDAVHWAMHVTMLFAGLLFFHVVFDPRDPPKGARFGIRQVMLVGTILTNIGIGSLTTLKETVLYTAYDVAGRPFGFGALADERAGGFLMWQPMSILSVLAILLVFNGWNRSEARHWERRHKWRASNSAALEYPETARELRMVVRQRNAAAARGLGLLSLSVFLVVFTLAGTLTILA